MAGQGAIQPEGDGFRAVFPFDGQQFEVHSLSSQEMAHAALLCLRNWAAEDAQRSQGFNSADSGSGPAASAAGGPLQLVREVQACVDRWSELYKFYENDHELEPAGQPAACWLMEAAVEQGSLIVAQQLLTVAPAEALHLLTCQDADRMPLHLAALRRHEAVFRLLLAAAPEAARSVCKSYGFGEPGTYTLMHSAARGGSTAVMRALLELHPDAAGWRTDDAPLHALLDDSDDDLDVAHFDAARLLLELAPYTATLKDCAGHTPLHLASLAPAPAIAELLLRAAPEAALVGNGSGQLPVHYALFDLGTVARQWNANLDERRRYLRLAHLLLPVSGLSPTQLLDALAGAGPAAHPLYPDLAACFALSDAEWRRMPAPCAGLGRALPAVLARSDAEARQLVQRLPAADQQQLRMAALCLGHVQRRSRVFLPTSVVSAILARCLL